VNSSEPPSGVKYASVSIAPLWVMRRTSLPSAFIR